MAILAVIIDHGYHFLWNTRIVGVIGCFSIVLFMLLSGITRYMSNERARRTWLETFIHSVSRIVSAYMLATFVYYIYTFHTFDLQGYLASLIHFDISSPLYYVFVYIQVMLANPLLYRLLKFSEARCKRQWLFDFSLLIVVIAVSSLTSRYTNMLDIWGGGRRLLGGSYLILFYIGLLLQKYNLLKPRTKRFFLFSSLLFGLLALVGLRFEYKFGFFLDQAALFGDGANPPGITSMLVGIVILLFCYSFFSALQYVRSKIVNGLLRIIAFFGKHSLAIYMYHLLVWSILTPIMAEKNIWFLRFTMVSAVLLIPSAFEWAFDKAHHYLFDIDYPLERKSDPK